MRLRRSLFRSRKKIGAAANNGNAALRVKYASPVSTPPNRAER